MREFPAWLARLNTSDLIATIGFSQLMPLLESMIVFIPMLFATAILSRRLNQEQRIAILFCFLAVSTVWAILFHYFIDSIREWRIEFLALGIVYLATNIIPIGIALQSKQFAAGVKETMERLNVLSAIYIAVDVICVLIVVGYLLI